MPKACDACIASRAVVYCRADAAYLCVSCDGKVHGANKLASRHERVWMCEVCEVAPAVVTCKADAASLCVACDTDIHSANPLAQRHERVPITPLFESSPSPSPVPVPAPVGALPSHTTQEGLLKSEDDVDTDGISSWLLPHHPKIPANAILRGSAAVGGAAVASPLSPFNPAKPQKLGILADIFSDVDPFLDLDDAAVTGVQPDSLVPVHTPEGSEDTATLKHSIKPSFTTDAAFPLKGKNHLNNNNNNNNKSSSSYGTSTLTHSMSCSSLEAAVVPESSVSDISTPYTVTTQGSLEVGARMGMPQQQQQPIDVVDREARVMRYKEKRQKRKFEKTIRYASRKAYAESRPRIKGRFAKRTDSDGDQMFESVDAGFGVVPTF